MSEEGNLALVGLNAACPHDPSNRLPRQPGCPYEVDLSYPSGCRTNDGFVERRPGAAFVVSGVGDDCSGLVLGAKNPRLRRIEIVDGCGHDGQRITRHVGTVAPCTIRPTNLVVD